MDMKKFLVFADYERASDYWTLSELSFTRLQSGQLASVPPEVRIGDTLCVFADSAMPCLLRATEDDEWLVLGSGFVYGAMYGEAMAADPNSLVDIVLV